MTQPSSLSSLFGESVKGRYICTGLIFSVSLLTCAVVQAAWSIHWKLFMSNHRVFYEVVDEMKQVVHVKRTTALLWTCFLVWPSCIIGMSLFCTRKKSMILLLFATAAIACVGSVISTAKSHGAYYEVKQFSGEQDDDDYDYDDDRCEDVSHNDVNYCECKLIVGPSAQPINQTTEYWRFKVDKCEDMEMMAKKIFVFFIFSMMTACFSACLFFMALIAFCSTNQTPMSRQQDESNYNSIKPQDRSMINKDEIGFSNPIFTNCNSHGEGRKTVFWYPYTGEQPPQSGNGAGGNYKFQHSYNQRKSVITLSKFSKSDEVVSF